MQTTDTMRLARAIITNASGQLLLAQRSTQTFLPGMWELAGGKLDAGESPAQAMIREVHEELSLHVTPLSLWGVHHDTFMGRPIETTIYHAVAQDGPVQLRPREHQAHGWFDVADAAALDLTTTAQAVMARTIAELLAA